MDVSYTVNTTGADAPTKPTQPPGRSSDFEEFVRVRSPALFRTALALTSDPQLAEDLLQTALAQAWRSWDRVHTSHEAFVRRTLVNTYVTWWRRKWNGERPTAELPEHPTHVTGHDDRLDLRDAVRQLPRRQRAVIVLRYFEDMPDAEIADVLGCSASTVRSQAHRALARLSKNPSLEDK
jgi:RNA polymerase sigma-70 factor (sigma-E family)